MGTMPFTKEQMQQAYDTDIVNYAISQGFEVENTDKNYKAYHIKNSGGLHLFKNGGYYCFSTQEKGNIVDFAIKEQGLSYLDAISNILNVEPYSKKENSVSNTNFLKRTDKINATKIYFKEDMVLPFKDENPKETINYLVNIRKLDIDIVQDLVTRGSIFQTSTSKGDYNFKNCCFVGFDESNKAKYCAIRSLSDKYKFRQDIKASSKEYAFSIKEKSERLYVFESPIDLISHMTLRKLNNMDFSSDSRLSTGGLNEKPILKFLENNKHIKEIVFCFDNDKNSEKNVGQEFAKKCYFKFKELGYKTYVEISQNKDFNEDLQVVKKVLEELGTKIKPKKRKENCI